MYLVIIFIFYFILISVLYTYLYVYLYLYIYSNFIILIIVIHYNTLNYINFINIYITFSGRNCVYFRIIKSINPRLTVLRATSIPNWFSKISDWFSTTTIKEKSL